MLSLDELERIGLTPSTSPFLRSPRRLSMKHLEKTTDGIDYVLAGQLGRQGRGKVRANRRQIENCSLNRVYILQIATSLLSHVAKRTVYSRRTARSANPFSAPTLHFDRWKWERQRAVAHLPPGAVAVLAIPTKPMDAASPL